MSNVPVSTLINFDFLVLSYVGLHCILYILYIPVKCNVPLNGFIARDMA